MALERLSVELTNQCAKACWFCYSASTPTGQTRWKVDEVVSFVTDCAARGLKAVSFGGGEPLEHPGVFDILDGLRGVLFRSLTTNGLLLDGEVLDRLVLAAPDEVHVSIHFPADLARVTKLGFVREAPKQVSGARTSRRGCQRAWGVGCSLMLREEQSRDSCSARGIRGSLISGRETSRGESLGLAI